MNLDMYASYDVSSALRGLDVNDSDAKWFADKQFGMVEDKFFAFWVLNPTDYTQLDLFNITGSKVTSALDITWVASRDYGYTGRYRHFPDELMGKNIHLFIRLFDEQLFVYVGLGFLGVVGLLNGQGHANITLLQRIKRTIWEKFGGYEGWLISVDKKQIITNDWDVLEPYISSIELDKGEHHIEMVRYEGDSLSILTRDDLGFAMYLRKEGDSGMSSRKPIPIVEDDEIVFRMMSGHGVYLKPTYVISKLDALSIIPHFMNELELPKNINWELD
ncbi:MAG: hypothetical protein AAFV93_01315 [Chloroflexota bacterium]